jgi:hypothetical protein
LREEIGKNFSDLNKKVDDVTKKVDDVKEQVNNLQQQVDDVRDELSGKKALDSAKKWAVKLELPNYSSGCGSVVKMNDGKCVIATAKHNVIEKINGTECYKGIKSIEGEDIKFNVNGKDVMTMKKEVGEEEVDIAILEVECNESIGVKLATKSGEGGNKLFSVVI